MLQSTFFPGSMHILCHVKFKNDTNNVKKNVELTGKIDSLFLFFPPHCKGITDIIGL